MLALNEPEKLKALSKDELIELLQKIFESSDVLKVSKPSKHEFHATAKPVELYEKLVRNSSTIDDVIYDPFAGGGVIFITAEMTGRTGLGVELDIDYAYNILKRFEAYTGELPILEETGEAYSFQKLETEGD